MITVGSRVCVTDFTDFFLKEGYVKKIKNGRAIVKFPHKPGEFTYNIDDLEEIEEADSKKAKSGKD